MLNPEVHPNLAKIQRLLLEYDSLKQVAIEAIKEEKLQEFNAVLQSFKEVKREGLERAKQVADTFNIFRILRIEYKETTLHSRLITNLLNPHGEHAQGSYFLVPFFKSVELDAFTENCNPSMWLSLDEAYAQQLGYIDILLYHPVTPKRAIIIENKVYSGDQPKQLLRYYMHCRNMGFSHDEIQILYLTPHGQMPVNQSFQDDQLGNLSSKIKPISYATHIRDWLKHSLTAELPSHLKAVLNQYTQIIENL